MFTLRLTDIKLKMFGNIAQTIGEITLAIATIVGMGGLSRIIVIGWLYLMQINLTDTVQQWLQILAYFVGVCTSAFIAWMAYHRARKIKIEADNMELSFRTEKSKRDLEIAQNESELKILKHQHNKLAGEEGFDRENLIN